VKIRYVGHAGTFKIPGPFTETVYTFTGHGATQEVDPRDAPGLLETIQRESRTCCGQRTGDQAVFAQADN
jgi:hypothetical protein